jgi:hypothetical protein
MWLITIIFIIIVSLVLYDITRILKLQDELIKEQYIMRGELNAILDMASLGTSYLPKFNVFKEEPVEQPVEKDETTTVEIKPE